MKNSVLYFIPITFLIMALTTGSLLEAQSLEYLDEYAAYISERYQVPGMVIGVIDEGEVVHQGYYGTYDIENKIAVDYNSLFNLHSLSKVFVNVSIFQLIEEGKLKLEDEITKYINDYPAHWEVVRVKHLLTHSSGLPNIIQYFDEDLEGTKENLYAASTVFPPGSDFDYNQTNYWLLNRIIGELSEEGFENTLRKQINGSLSTPLLFDEEMGDGTIQPKEYRPGPNKSLRMEYSEVPSYMNGAGGVNISLDDFIRWNLQLDNNELIASTSKSQMWDPFIFSQSEHDFAYGWGIYRSNGTSSVGFSGGGVAGLRKFIKENLTIIIMTNGYQFNFNVNTLVNWIAGHVREELNDASSILHMDLYKIFLQERKEVALSDFIKLKSRNQHIDMDPMLNSLGYELLAKGNAKKALTVFELNTIENPDSWNAWDSLAEGYELSGSTELAVKYYNKSLELNSNNQHAIERLENIRINIITKN